MDEQGKPPTYTFVNLKKPVLHQPIEYQCRIVETKALSILLQGQCKKMVTLIETEFNWTM